MTKLTSHDNNIAKFDMTIPYEDFSKACDQAFKRNRNRFKVDGFRKGKVPRQIIERMYGPSVFYDDAFQLVFPKFYEKALDELDLDVIDQPSVDFENVKKDEDITLHVEVETKPHPEICNLEEITVEKEDEEVKDEDIQKELERQQLENARIIPVEGRKAKEKDIVNIDFDGEVDGVKFDGGKSENYDLELGSNTFIPGFETQVEGHEIGETFDVKVDFPENYQAVDLAGKSAVFKVTINSIKEKQLPEIDDEFAKDISEFDTLEELKKDIREKLAVEKKKVVRRNLENKIIEQLIEKSDVKAPKAMVERQIDTELDNFSQRVSQLGITMDQYIQMIGGDIKDLREQLRAQAETRVKADLVVDEVALKENIEATEEEIEQEIKDAFESSKVKDYDKFKEAFKKNVSERFVKENIQRRKAIELMVEKANITQKGEEK